MSVSKPPSGGSRLNRCTTLCNPFFDMVTCLLNRHRNEISERSSRTCIGGTQTSGTMSAINNVISLLISSLSVFTLASAIWRMLRALADEGITSQGRHNVVDIPDAAGGLDHHRVSRLKVLFYPVPEARHLNFARPQGPFLMSVLAADHHIIFIECRCRWFGQ